MMSMAFHHRYTEKRKYDWMVCISGVVLKNKSNWKIKHLQFSLPNGDFPDERFENSLEHKNDYLNQVKLLSDTGSEKSDDVKILLHNLETRIIGSDNVSSDFLSRYFSKDAYIVGTDSQVHIAYEQIEDYLKDNSCLKLQIDEYLESKENSKRYITVIGTLRQIKTENDLVNETICLIPKICDSNLSVDGKLLSIQRNIAAALKETTSGEIFTWPIRFTAIIGNNDNGAYFDAIHFSHPFYWIFEGKFDTEKNNMA